jgi:hypothetical protein
MPKADIPHVIHYCWFGGKPLSELAQSCIESWKKFCPDYQIVRWDESNTDLESCDYVKEAYEAKKWAFVSDFVRFQVLYEQGGLYFDTDVQLIKPIDPIVEKGPFMGIESSPGDYVGGNSEIVVAPGLGIAAEKGNAFYAEVLNYYRGIHFSTEKTVGMHVTALLIQNGLKVENSFQTVCGINIWPKEYFNPMNLNSGIPEITENTVSIHLYEGTWVDSKTRFRDKTFQFIYRVFGEKVSSAMKKAYRKIFN